MTAKMHEQARSRLAVTERERLDRLGLRQPNHGEQKQ
jgi:hypothetical protein